MTYVTYTARGKPQLEKARTFCNILKQVIPKSTDTFTELLGVFDATILAAHPEISQGALNNAHGDWYEWLLAIAAWNHHVDNSGSHLALLLPNVKQFDVVRLYKNSLYDLIVDLRGKVEEATSAQLVTSNPDFVLVDTTRLEISTEFNQKIEQIDENAISLINNAYKKFVSQCDFEDIVGYLSVKTSFRPDRRLQIPHEGSLMKAIYTHLQTRQWIIAPKGLKYYAMTTKVSEADRNALKTVATHSITTVHTVPQAAVDEVFQVNSLQQAEQVYQQILH